MMDKHREIHSALAKDFTTRRGLLRELATPILRDQNVKIANAMDASPLIGEDSHQISVRKTYTGLRDSMSIEGLVAVASESVTIDDVCDALVNPEQIDEGQWVLYDVEDGRKGPEATEVEAYDGEPPEV